MNPRRWFVALTVASTVAASVTITRYQAGAARVMICQDGRGFIVFHPGGLRETYGTGFTLETIEWFHGLGSVRSRQIVDEDAEASCTRDTVQQPTGIPNARDREDEGRSDTSIPSAPD